MLPKVTDAVVRAVQETLGERSILGVKKYNTTLEKSGLTYRQLLQHLLEEQLDAANYTMALIMQHDAEAEKPKISLSTFAIGDRVWAKHGPTGIDVDCRIIGGFGTGMFEVETLRRSLGVPTRFRVTAEQMRDQ